MEHICGKLEIAQSKMSLSTWPWHVQNSISDKKYKKSMQAALILHDIIPLVQKVWDASFVRVEENKNVIADRGWNPLNRNLLTLPDFWRTMTKDDWNYELSNCVFLPTTNVCANRETSPLYDPFYFNAYRPNNGQQLTLNFSDGDSGFCIEFIILYQDLMSTHEQKWWQVNPRKNWGLQKYLCRCFSKIRVSSFR